MIKELWVLEWSHKSNGFHIQKACQMASANRVAYMEDRKPQDWVVIHLGTKDECHEAADAARVTLIQREKLRPMGEVL